MKRTVQQVSLGRARLGSALRPRFAHSITHNAHINVMSPHTRDRKTGIICTVGPATESPEMIRELLFAGMGVMRLNESTNTLRIVDNPFASPPREPRPDHTPRARVTLPPRQVELLARISRAQGDAHQQVPPHHTATTDTDAAAAQRIQNESRAAPDTYICTYTHCPSHMLTWRAARKNSCLLECSASFCSVTIHIHISLLMLYMCTHTG